MANRRELIAGLGALGASSLFGGDFPNSSVAGQVAGLRESGFTEEELRGHLSGQCVEDLAQAQLAKP